MKKINSLLSIKNRRILMLLILDIIILALSSFLALALRFDFINIPVKYINTISNYFIIDVVILVLIFILFRLYLSIWSYASITELISIAFACTSYTIIEFTYKYLFDIKLPRSYYLIKFLLLIIFVSGVRYAYRILRTIRGFSSKGNINTMIVGAGDAGRLLITEIYNNPTNFGNRVACVIDDNRNKIGSYIRGIPVVGNCKEGL